jgi:hypothetical protein
LVGRGSRTFYDVHSAEDDFQSIAGNAEPLVGRGSRTFYDAHSAEDDFRSIAGNAEPRAEPLVPRRAIHPPRRGVKIPAFRLQAGGLTQRWATARRTDRPCTRWIRIGHRRCEHPFVVREPRPTSCSALHMMDQDRSQTLRTPIRSHRSLLRKRMP